MRGRSLSFLPVVCRYFYSGWAFLIPYLLAYLIYYWRKWPVNPQAIPQGSLLTHPPPLLHIYWLLHAINGLLGLLALKSWWTGLPENHGSAFRFPYVGFLSWVFLGLIFFVPGVYLEFPSDTWDHLRRINEWVNLLHVSDHSSWSKSSSFLAYSLLGRIPASRQLSCLDFYNAGACLLLCWQYFRLAEAVGLQKRPAFVFVLLQAVLLGNVTFSFYRYYGFSSTIFAQVGAIAIIRIWLDLARCRFSMPGIFNSMIFTGLLLVYVALNHPQGMAIAGLGLAAVAIWRLIEWRRWTILALAATAVVWSFAAIRLFPRDPAIDGVFRPLGIFTSWYGFNLFSFHSLSSDRALQILGLFGVLNLFLGLVILLLRNHIIGWLTVMPVLALVLPFVAIPFAGAIVRSGDWESIIVFHRLLFSIPAGLAIVGACDSIHKRGARAAIARAQHVPLLTLVIVLLALVTVPPTRPYHNRFWNVMARTPDDLAMTAVWTEFHRYAHSPVSRGVSVVASGSSLGFVLLAQRPVRLLYFGRGYYNDARTQVNDFDAIRDFLRQPEASSEPIVILSPIATHPYTFSSFAGICSGHWLPQEVAAAFSGGPQLKDIALEFGLRPSVTANEPVNYYQSGKR